MLNGFRHLVYGCFPFSCCLVGRKEKKTVKITIGRRSCCLILAALWPFYFRFKIKWVFLVCFTFWFPPPPPPPPPPLPFLFYFQFVVFLIRDHKKLRQHVKTETSFGVLLFGQLNSMLHFLKSKESKALCSLFHFLKPEEQKALCSRFRLFSFSTNLTSFQFLKSEKQKAFFRYTLFLLIVIL